MKLDLNFAYSSCLICMIAVGDVRTLQVQNLQSYNLVKVEAIMQGKNDRYHVHQIPFHSLMYAGEQLWQKAIGSC
eukprot:1804043-Amphidinium_carterae.1